MHNPIGRWIKPVDDASDVGYRWETTPDGSDRRTGVVYKGAVIPQPLTSEWQNSYQYPYLMHSSGKAGKTAIQRVIRFVN